LDERIENYFPYGLNERCKGKDFTKKKDLHDVTAAVFNKIPVPRKKGGSGKNRWSQNFNIDKFLRDVVQTHRSKQNWIFFTRKMITSLSKRTLKKLGLQAREYSPNSTAPSVILDVIQDLVDYRLSVNRKNIEVKKKDNFPLIKVFFCNKGIEQS
jgi:hypothetical protein